MTCLALLALTACGERGGSASHEHGHDHGHDHGEEPAAAFKEGHGLSLAPETARALGVVVEEIAPRSIAYRINVYASVFRAGPPARASALVTEETARALERHPPQQAKIIALDRTRASGGGSVELTLELPAATDAGASLSLVLTGPANEVVAVPVGAVLRSVTGTFVYVVNGGALLRTPVVLGATDGVYQEITDGVYEGDEIAVAAVEQLWLTELRLTKGGGHSH